MKTNCTWSSYAFCMAAATELPQHVRGLAELLARQPSVEAGTGKKRLELLYENGRLIEAIVHARIPARELEEQTLE